MLKQCLNIKAIRLWRGVAACSACISSYYCITCGNCYHFANFARLYFPSNFVACLDQKNISL